MEEAKARLIFDHEKGELDYGKRRTTDCKQNSRVIFPKKTDLDTESRLTMLRVETMALVRNYIEEKCNKKGQQKMNLTASEARGLRSLKTRVKEGEIVVLPTDKTGKFAVMSRDYYEKSGLSHTQNDEEVGLDKIKVEQREINGHVAMLIKIFNIGGNWGHEERIRETMMGESMEVCPVQLLYKDHKGWDPTKGGIPPTRHVAGGHVGIGLHLSEIVSDLIEPMVGRIEGGREIISGEDLLARVDKINVENRGWTPVSWWAGKNSGNFEACELCIGDDEYVWDEGEPELCKCKGGNNEITNQKLNTEVEKGENKLPTSPKVDSGAVKTTINFVRTRRRLVWVQEIDWEDEDLDRLVDSTEALQEDLQDWSSPYIVIGSDVVSLYPNLHHSFI